MFQKVPLSFIRSFSLYTQQWYVSYRFADSILLWNIPLLCVQWNTPDDGQSNSPKHVEFYSKNKFEKLVHLVGFIIRMFIYEVKIQSCHLKCCWKCITCRLFTGFLHSLIILYSVSNWQNHSKGVISLYCVLLFKLKFALHSQYWTYSRVYLPFVGKIFPPLFYPSKPPRPPQRRLHHVRPPTTVQKIYTQTY